MLSRPINRMRGKIGALMVTQLFESVPGTAKDKVGKMTFGGTFSYAFTHIQ